MGIEDCGVRVVDDQLYVSEEDPDDLKAEITELRAKIAPPVAWSGWACQFPGHMPRLYGDKAIAEINCDYDGGAQLLFLSSIPPAPAYPERLPCPVRLMLVYFLEKACLLKACWMLSRDEKSMRPNWRL